MKSISLRSRLGIVALAYAAVLTVAAVLLYGRHLSEARHSAEVIASGGMYAAGDTLLEMFIAGLFTIPTVFLIWVSARFEAFYKAYSQLLLALSLRAPVCLSVLFLGEQYSAQSVIIVCLYGLFWSPFLLVGIGVSRLVARFDRANRLVSYALLIEGLTLANAVALLLHGIGSDNRRPADHESRP